MAAFMDSQGRIVYPDYGGTGIYRNSTSNVKEKIADSNTSLGTVSTSFALTEDSKGNYYLAYETFIAKLNTSNVLSSYAGALTGSQQQVVDGNLSIARFYRLTDIK